MPILPLGLCLGAFPKRADPTDCLLTSKPYANLNELPVRAKLGTNSLRRQGALLHVRPDLEIVPIRGNIDTRLSKIQNHELDGIVLAATGIERLGLDLSVLYRLSLKDVILPAVGQGVLAIEYRTDDKDTLKLVQTINDKQTANCVHVEREFLRTLGGNCNFPIGGYVHYVNDMLVFTGSISSPNGEHVITAEITATDPQNIGKQVA